MLNPHAEELDHLRQLHHRLLQLDAEAIREDHVRKHPHVVEEDREHQVDRPDGVVRARRLGLDVVLDPEPA
jgi:hypothetical protein